MVVPAIKQIDSPPDADVQAAGLCVDHFVQDESEETPVKTGALAHANSSRQDANEWSVERVGIDEVLAEVKSGTFILSQRAIRAWAKEGQVHRLAKLADELLLHAEEFTPSMEALDMMVMVAACLGIVRPLRASRLTEAVQKSAHWQSAHFESDLSEAQKWTQAGLLLEPCGMTERVLWNNRLRNPEMDWNWETPEARMALERLQNILPGAPEPVLDLYRTAVPDCWWDLFERTCLNDERLLPKVAPPDHRISLWSGSFRAIALVGIGTLIGGALTTWGVAMRIVDLPAFHGDSAQPQIIFNESVREIAAPPTVPQMVEPAAPQIAAPMVPKIVPPKVAPPLSWRDQEIVLLKSEFPALERLQRTLATGTLKDAEPILRGSSSIASLRTPAYRALLRWSMLAPPADADVRRAVIRLFTLTPPFAEALPVLEKAARDGEPYHAEMKDMAGILLGAKPVPLLAEQIERLKQIAK